MMLMPVIALKLTAALVCFTFAGFFGYLAHQRRQVAVWAMASFAVFMVCSGLMHLVSACNAWPVNPALDMAMSVLTALAGVIAVVYFGKQLRTIASLPSRAEMLEVNEALARANRELEAFTASVSHDLRSPLTTIAGQAGLLEMSAGAKLDDEQKRRLHRIHASVKQMSELIEALLNLSRISQLTLHRESVDISVIAEKVLAELAQNDPARDVEVRVAPGLRLHGDPRLLTSVMENLLNNAWKFTSKTERACIEVGGENRGQTHSIYVRDNGDGFDMAYHDKLFHPFQRLHLPTQFPGSGVGLATAQRIVAHHGGRIWAESKPGEGATFWFTVGNS